MRNKSYLIFTLLLMVFFACNNKSESLSNEDKIAGKEKKRWEATRETNASGSVDRLTRTEKKEKITFSRNGNVLMENDEQVLNGQWSLQTNTLRLQFPGSDVTEDFTIIELEDDKMRLKAGDGSELTMKPD